MLSGQNLRLLCQWDWFAQVLRRSLLGQMLLNLFDWFDQIPKWYQKAQKLLCQWDLFALVLKLSLQSQMTWLSGQNLSLLCLWDWFAQVLTRSLLGQMLLNLFDWFDQIPEWNQQAQK
ncbi:hypothetical protein NQZ68_038138 [Dissostichus eleginoides]|nr:hypothetical protein NQZ68_038138 [Dissostichus eleginoides]